MRMHASFLHTSNIPPAPAFTGEAVKLYIGHSLSVLKFGLLRLCTPFFLRAPRPHALRFESYLSNNRG